MNTLANPHIAKLRAAPEPVSADDHPGDNLDRWHEKILAEEWQAEAWAEGHRPALRDEGRVERREVNEGRKVAYWRLTRREAVE